jgi:hypothetical protein
MPPGVSEASKAIDFSWSNQKGIGHFSFFPDPFPVAFLLVKCERSQPFVVGKIAAQSLCCACSVMVCAIGINIAPVYGS